MTGFMAPPLKPSINFFVLTETPMAVCPFCSTDADWPYNMVVIYVNGSVDALPYDQEVTVTGTPGSWQLYGWGYGLCEPGSPS